ncbi:MAG: hypothetical protein ABSH05_17330 [Bryobacteraceae bacterium]|jgi:hypothetical protein
MGPGNQDAVSPLLVRALAGIQTGVLGGLAMFGWLAASSAVERQSVWIVPNLLGSLFYGRDVLWRSFSRTTVAGLALHLFVTGLIGLGFGMAVGESRNRLRVALLGIFSALVWYHFSELLFWRKLGALAMIYSPPRSMLLAHLVYGFALAWHPSGLHSGRRRFLGEPAPGPVE